MSGNGAVIVYSSVVDVVAVKGQKHNSHLKRHLRLDCLLLESGNKDKKKLG